MVRVETANTNGRIGWCIEGHDLAASQLVALKTMGIQAENGRARRA
jgi:hypothetical protein